MSNRSCRQAMATSWFGGARLARIAARWPRSRPADGKLSNHGCTVMEVRNGKIGHAWVYFEGATQAAYKAQRKVLLEFYHDSKGDLRDVVQKIRPVLETY